MPKPPSWELQVVARVREDGALRLGKYSSVDSALVYYMNEWDVWFLLEHGRRATSDEYNRHKSIVAANMAYDFRMAVAAVTFRTKEN